VESRCTLRIEREQQCKSTGSKTGLTSANSAAEVIGHRLRPLAWAEWQVILNLHVPEELTILAFAPNSRQDQHYLCTNPVEGVGAMGLEKLFAQENAGAGEVAAVKSANAIRGL
jgi:hypothetical protein